MQERLGSLVEIVVDAQKISSIDNSNSLFLDKTALHPLLCWQLPYTTFCVLLIL